MRPAITPSFKKSLDYLSIKYERSKKKSTSMIIALGITALIDYFRRKKLFFCRFGNFYRKMGLKNYSNCTVSAHNVSLIFKFDLY